MLAKGKDKQEKMKNNLKSENENCIKLWYSLVWNQRLIKIKHKKIKKQIIKIKKTFFSRYNIKVKNYWIKKIFFQGII